MLHRVLRLRYEATMKPNWPGFLTVLGGVFAALGLWILFLNPGKPSSFREDDLARGYRMFAPYVLGAGILLMAAGGVAYLLRWLGG